MSTRNQNKKAHAEERKEQEKRHTTQLYGVSFDNRELSFLAFAYGNLTGLDREKGRIVVGVIDELRLNDENRSGSLNATLSGYELHSILDTIGSIFDRSQMPAVYVDLAFQIEDRLTALMEAVVEKEEDSQEEEVEEPTL